MNRIERCGEKDYQTLAEIWERSVRASHAFLSEKDIEEIREALIPVYFQGVELYGIVDGDALAGFIGVSGKNIEMLFVDDGMMGKGLGKQLVDYAKGLGAETVEVNEQNPRALKFYVANGFRVVGREEQDGDGRPFPILFLSL